MAIDENMVGDSEYTHMRFFFYIDLKFKDSNFRNFLLNLSRNIFEIKVFYTIKYNFMFQIEIINENI